MSESTAGLLAQIIVGLLIAGAVELHLLVGPMVQLRNELRQVPRETARDQRMIHDRELIVVPWQARLSVTLLSIMAMALGICVNIAKGNSTAPLVVSLGLVAGILLIVLLPVFLISNLADTIEDISRPPGAVRCQAERVFRTTWFLIFVVLPITVSVVGIFL